MAKRPSLEERCQFLQRSYFGVSGDQVDLIISRAYRDMNRTLRNLSKTENAKELIASAKSTLRDCLNDLTSNPAYEADAFDHWHRCTCAKVIACFKSFHCNFGQAQKWINMTIKYRWFFGDDGLDRWYAVAHVPVDEFILRAAERVLGKRPCDRWSKWDKPEEYEDFQYQLREHSALLRMTPLQLEHRWWMEESTKRNDRDQLRCHL